MELMTTCPICNESEAIDVNLVDYQAWQDGMLIQHAFPDMSPDKREQLMTGICPSCWDNSFGDC